MFEERHIPNRKLDERIVVYVRPHWIHLLSALFLFIVLSLIPIAIYFVASNSIANYLSNSIGYALLIMLGGIYYLSAILIFFNSFLDLELDVWIVTNYRIIAIEQKGLFNRTFSEHYIERVQDVSAAQKGILQTMFNYGDVQIQTSAEQEKFVFNDVHQPVEIAEKINSLLGKKL